MKMNSIENINKKLEQVHAVHAEKVATRPLDNSYILDKLAKYLEKHPELRFIQALCGVGILDSSLLTDKDGKDLFYEESADTLQRLLDNKIEI